MNEVQLKPEDELRGIAERINIIKEQTKTIMAQASIEIGRQLWKAKKLVPHGNWGSWLKEHVDYSQRTASNLIRIYEEYGEGQQLLFGKTMDQQTLASLSYTQAVALLAISDPDERAEFAETHDVAAMSTRELEEAIKGRDEATKELETLKEKHKSLESRMEALRSEEQEKRKKLQEEKDKLEKDYASASANEKAAEKELEELKAQAAGGNREAEAKSRELEAQLAMVKGRMKELELELEAEKGKPIEAAIVKEDTDETKAELEKLRAQIAEMKEKPQDEGLAREVEVKLCIGELRKGFNRLMELIGEMEPERKEKYQGATKKLLAILTNAAEEA